MKKLLVGLIVGASLLLGAVCFAQTAEENAQVILTVTNFRPMKSLTSPEFVDTTTALAPHDAVTLVNKNGTPTLQVKRAVNIEISIAPSVSGETYRPLAVYFRQKTNTATTVSDPEGAANFTQSISPTGKLVMRHNCTLRGDNGSYEFFVLVQRLSDGAIGLIDPDIDTETGE